MNSRPPYSNTNKQQEYSKAVKEYIVNKIDRKSSQNLSETTIGKPGSKRNSIEGGQSSILNNTTGGSRRSSKSSSINNIGLPPPKSIDNFLSNTQKNFKEQANNNDDLDKFSLQSNPATENQDEFDSIQQNQQDESQQQIHKEEEQNLFPDKHIYEKQTLQLGNEENKILCMRYDTDDQFIAVACEDGIVRVINESKGIVAYTLQDFSEKPQPATSLRWCTDERTMKHGLLVTYSGGKCLYWHVTSNQVLARYEEKGNDINTCEFTYDGKQFITAGSDSKIRLYDIGKKHSTVFTTGSCPEHKNRVFASKFANENTLLTAGWDQNVLLWDIRTKSTQGYIYGPLICGDSLDCRENTVLTGSWRNNKQLQLWDLRKTNRSIDLVWDNHSDNPSHQSFIYSCQFSKTDGNYILAGSTGTYEMRLFDRINNNRCIDALTENINKGVFSLDWSHKKQRAAYGTSDGRWASAEVY